MIRLLPTNASKWTYIHVFPATILLAWLNNLPMPQAVFFLTFLLTLVLWSYCAFMGSYCFKKWVYYE